MTNLNNLPTKYKKPAPERNNISRFVFIVYFVDEAEPFRPREVRMVTRNTELVKIYLEDQILRGNIQYGERFNSTSQLAEFRADWVSKPKSLVNDKMRYAAITAVNENKELTNFRIQVMYNQLVYNTNQEAREKMKYIFLVYSGNGNVADISYFTSDPTKLRSFFEDGIKKEKIHYGDTKAVSTQLEEFKTDWQTKPKSYINSKLKGCAMTAVVDGKVLDMFSLS